LGRREYHFVTLILETFLLKQNLFKMDGLGSGRQKKRWKLGRERRGMEKERFDCAGPCWQRAVYGRLTQNRTEEKCGVPKEQ
jgi:hypothetical protein